MLASAQWWWGVRIGAEALVDASPLPDPALPESDQQRAERLAQARTALDRGEYGKVLRLLEPLAQGHGPATALGAGVRLLMATALMGQGQTDQAAALCRALQACGDAGLRSRARDLLLVLEAPVLRRPRDWSLTLPELQGEQTLAGRAAAGRRRRSDEPPAEPPPPVGQPRQPLGFVAVVGVLLALLLLASLLGGCMQVRTDLRFAGPGRLQISHHLRSRSGPMTPWQQRLGSLLQQDGAFRLQLQGPEEVLTTPVLAAPQALDSLGRSLVLAASLGGVDLPEPVLRLQERNWLVGVQQVLDLNVDLGAVPRRAGLDLALRLEPVGVRAVRQASPLPPRPQGGRRLLWPLEPGTTNHLVLRCWRWSALGLGAALIGLSLALVVALQGLRRALGFGLPELPA